MHNTLKNNYKMGKGNKQVTAGITVKSGDLLYKGEVVGAYTTYSVNVSELNKIQKQQCKKSKK